MTTIFDTFAHSSKNSSTQTFTFSDRKLTTASVVSYMILLLGRMILLPARFPSGCWTYLSLTQVTTCALSSDHQFSGITRMFGMAASAAGAPERMSVA